MPDKLSGDAVRVCASAAVVAGQKVGGRKSSHLASLSFVVCPAWCCARDDAREPQRLKIFRLSPLLGYPSLDTPFFQPLCLTLAPSGTCAFLACFRGPGAAFGRGAEVSHVLRNQRLGTSSRRVCGEV